MKKFTLISVLVVCAIPLLASLALAGDHPKSGEQASAGSGWFDFENCAFCKNLSEDPGLLEHTTWETHEIKSGMLTIMTVDPAYAKSLAKAEKAMQDLGMKIQSGEVNPMTLKMCGHCQSFGMIMMSGKVNMEEVRGDAAIISLATSDDAGIVQQLHVIAQTNRKEMAQMENAHSGHGHGNH